MIAKIEYIKFKKFTFMCPNVIIQRSHRPLPTTYQHISFASQWRLCDAVSKLLNEAKAYIELAPDGEFELQPKN